MPIFLKMAFDEDDDVRNNAVFGIGELVLHAGTIMHQHFNQILDILSKLMIKEEGPRCLDQIVGATCRLILANKNLIPMEQVFPVICQKTPLREDMDEYKTLFETFQLLYVGGMQPQILQITPKIIECALHVMHSDEEFDKEKVWASAKCLLDRLNQDHPDQFKSFLTSFPNQQISSLGFL